MGNMRASQDPLGELLLADDVLSHDALEDALSVQRDGFPLASVVYLLGLAGEEPLVRVLSRQVGTPGVLLERSIISVHNLRELPKEIALRYGILPLYRDRELLFVGVGERLDPGVLNELSIITGRSVIPHVALHAILARAIRQCYALLASGEAYWFGNQTSIEDLNDPQGVLTPVLDVDDLPDEMVARPLDVTDPNLAVPVGPGDIVYSTEAEEDAAVSESDDLGIDRVEPLPPPKRILVADPDREARERLADLLAAEGHQVEQRATGAEAIQAIREAPPDLAILAVLLPDIHGYDICRRLKSSRRYAALPVALLSSVGSSADRDQRLAERYLADAILRSPITPTALLGTTNRLLLYPSRTVSSDGLETDQSLFESAIEHYRSGRPDQAVEELKAALEIDPFSPRSHFVLANILQHQGRFYEAIDAYERTVELRPDYFPALTRLAYLHYKQGFLPRAIATWRRAVEACDPPEQQAKIAKVIESLEQELARRRTEDRSAPVAPSPPADPLE